MPTEEEIYCLCGDRKKTRRSSSLLYLLVSLHYVKFVLQFNECTNEYELFDLLTYIYAYVTENIDIWQPVLVGRWHLYLSIF